MTGVKLSKKARRVFADYLLRAQDGEVADFDELCRSHSSIEAELRTLQENWVAADCKMAAPSVAQDFTIRLKGIYGDSADSGVTLRPQDTDADPDSGLERLKRLTAKTPSGTRYVFLGEIARGGMGVVLHVWDTVLRRNLAMKVIPSQRTDASGGAQSATASVTVSRFLEEAQVAAQLDHPGVVPVHDLGIDANGQVYFTMPLIEGRDLQAIFEMVREGKEGWTLTRALGVILDVCHVMAYAHSRGVIHRDLKPANVMVGKFGETYVMDWGLAKVIGREDRAEVMKRLMPESPADTPAPAEPVRTDRGTDPSSSPLLTLAGTVIGTPAYMPPEQAQGRLGELCPQSDVYSVGAMLYHLLTGQMPYVKKRSQVAPRTILKMVVNGPPPPAQVLDPTVGNESVAICDKAMARTLEARYAAMTDMQSDLQAYLEGRVVTAYETGALAQFRKLVTRNKAVSAVIASSLLIAVGALLVVTYVYMQWNRQLEQANFEIRRARDSALERRDDETRPATLPATRRG